MKLFNRSMAFNWRIFLVRILVNAVTLAVLALLPGIRFIDPSIVKLLLMALTLGLINAFVKPIIQFLTLQFLFVTYGFVIILINALVLLLVAWLFKSYEVASLWAALFGGAVIGLVSSFLESLFGVAPPILPEKPPELKRQIAVSQASPVQAALTRRVAPQGQFAESAPETESQAPVPPAEAPRSAAASATQPATGPVAPSAVQNQAPEQGGEV